MSPIFVAIDTRDVDRAASLAGTVSELAAGLKLGLEFFCANGHDGVHHVAQAGLPIFLDLKLHDIPNTVGKAVEAIAPLQPAILTVHAAGGRTMMAAARAASPPETKIVAVTVLTSLDAADLAEAGVIGSPLEQVQRLTDLSREAGLDGIVCSGAEVAAARAAWPEGFFVVPGVRSAGGDPGDQKRVVSPRQALDDGASVLVVGRAVTSASDPAGALADIVATLPRIRETARISP